MDLYFMQCCNEREQTMTVCYRKQQVDVSFSYVCPVLDNEFCHNIVKVVLGIHSYFDNEIHDQEQDRCMKN